MTREEEIDNAKTVFYERVLEDDYYYDPRDCFEEGAKWADEHPKSPWISVKDYLPSMCTDLVINAIATKNVIVLLNDGRIRETQLICGHWKEYDKKVTHWMPIPELPKE